MNEEQDKWQVMRTKAHYPYRYRIYNPKKPCRACAETLFHSHEEALKKCRKFNEAQENRK